MTHTIDGDGVFSQEGSNQELRRWVLHLRNDGGTFTLQYIMEYTDGNRAKRCPASS